ESRHGKSAPCGCAAWQRETHARDRSLPRRRARQPCPAWSMPRSVRLSPIAPAGGNHPVRASYPHPARSQNTLELWLRRGGNRSRLTLRMREDVLGGPAGEVEPDPVREEPEAGLYQFGAALARQHDVELLAQGM